MFFNYIFVSIFLLSFLVAILVISKLVRVYSFKIGRNLKQRVMQGDYNFEDENRSALSTVISIIFQNSSLSEKALEGRIRRYKRELRRKFLSNNAFINLLLFSSYAISLIYSSYNLITLITGLNKGISYSEMVIISFDSALVLLVTVALTMPFYILNFYINEKIKRIEEEIEDSSLEIIAMIKGIK